VFIGRERELKKLQEFLARSVAGLIVVCGRRRVGKSTLIEHFAASSRFIELYGLAPRKGLTMQNQLDHFGELLGIAFDMSPLKFDNWNAALSMLAQLTATGKVIILLDEISWMAGTDEDFAGKLKGMWDTKFKKNPELTLILCGSVTSWIEENILSDKGFVGRISLTITLEEMPLKDANKFWGTWNISAAEKCKILSVTGGIPRYLEEIRPEDTAEQNLKRLGFSPGGILVEDFDKIFKDIFGKRANNFKLIVQALANGSREIGELCQALGVKQTGGFSKKLHALTLSGFITRDYVWDKSHKKPKHSRYRLKDNYMRFYLKYIDPKRELINSGMYEELFLEDLPEWHTIMGLQFENLVLSNLGTIQHLLHISSSSILSAAPYIQHETKRQKACQIDLLLQCRYSIYVCETKCRHKITPEVIDEVAEKIARLNISKDVSIRPVLIYQGELSPEIKRANFFTHLISFEDMLMA
jgi:AAA+ ATPase superfamily predicted ATPase